MAKLQWWRSLKAIEEFVLQNDRLPSTKATGEKRLYAWVRTTKQNAAAKHIMKPPVIRAKL
jgi:hypothetical protein